MGSQAGALDSPTSTASNMSPTNNLTLQVTQRNGASVKLHMMRLLKKPNTAHSTRRFVQKVFFVLLLSLLQSMSCGRQNDQSLRETNLRMQKQGPEVEMVECAGKGAARRGGASQETLGPARVVCKRMAQQGSGNRPLGPLSITRIRNFSLSITRMRFYNPQSAPGYHETFRVLLFGVTKPPVFSSFQETKGTTNYLFGAWREDLVGQKLVHFLEELQ